MHPINEVAQGKPKLKYGTSLPIFVTATMAMSANSKALLIEIFFIIILYYKFSLTHSILHIPSDVKRAGVTVHVTIDQCKQRYFSLLESLSGALLPFF